MGRLSLHNLLAVDPRFAFPKVYEVVAPHTFLLLEPIAPIGSFFLPRTRFGVDNMALSVEVSAEDEAALSVMTLLSPVVGFAFPERADFYDRYLTFRDASSQEVERWKSALLAFARKLTWKYKRPLVLKSPGHTCRIRLILETFPDARFVHVHRNPYVVYQSMMRLMAAVWGIYSFQQPPEPAAVHARVIRQYRAMYEAFFEERNLIPAGRYCEVGFEELERDPLGEMARIYDQLSLPDFAVVRSDMEQYVRSLAGYQKNVYPDLPVEVESEISDSVASVLRGVGLSGWRLSVRGRQDGLAGKPTGEARPRFRWWHHLWRLDAAALGERLPSSSSVLAEGGLGHLVQLGQHAAPLAGTLAV